MIIAILTVLAALAFAGFVAYRVWRSLSGVSWTLGPLARVTRKDDPFSFWTSILPLIAVVVLLLGAAIARLVTH